MKVRVGLSKTINIGNFENLKPSVEIEDELQYINKTYDKKICDKELETPEECYERLYQLCSILLNNEIKKINSSISTLENKEKEEWVTKYKSTMKKEI